MGFADLYLERYGSGPVEGLPEPDPDLFLIVTLPAYREPDLETSLRSLLDCESPGVPWEILVHVNYPEGSSPEIVALSEDSVAMVRMLERERRRSDARLIPILSRELPLKHAGVGLARKTAMDLAVSRFNRLGRKEGVILAFDADSTCDPGYLKAVSAFYSSHAKARTANIHFEHPLSGPLDERHYRSIAQYELYLRYMRLAVRETGHPFAIHTVGSSFTVRAGTYIRVNGMGRDKAGEDFYFLNKCAGLGHFWEINDTAIYPSARESDRVIFGTGATVQKQVKSETMLEVYDLGSFDPLQDLFAMAPHFWDPDARPGRISQAIEGLHPGLAGYLRSIDAVEQIVRMQGDSASVATFLSKFHTWFGNFRILKYLNGVHGHYYTKRPVSGEARKLADRLGIGETGSVGELLAAYRDYERGRGNIRII